MAQIFFLCIILANAFVGLAMANKNVHPPALSPSSGENLNKAQAPMLTRKLGKHHILSPSAAPQAEEKMHAAKEPSSPEQTASSEEEIHLSKHHHSMDKSVAGGGVILGGLATAFLVAVFCYIRATGRHKGASNVEHGSETRI